MTSIPCAVLFLRHDRCSNGLPYRNVVSQTALIARLHEKVTPLQALNCCCDAEWGAVSICATVLRHPHIEQALDCRDYVCGDNLILKGF